MLEPESLESVDDAADRDVIDVIGTPRARNVGPPLFDPVRNVLVHYDMTAAQVAAHRYHGPDNLELLWQHALNNAVQFLCWAEIGERCCLLADFSILFVVYVQAPYQPGFLVFV